MGLASAASLVKYRTLWDAIVAYPSRNRNDIVGSCDMDAQSDPCLVLELNGHQSSVAAKAVSEGGFFLLGKTPACRLIVDRELTSRIHARIERHHKDFYLVDESTNGTFVQTEDEQVTLVHRDRIKLWGAGWISLGEPLHATTPIHFRQA